ncbi:hypothetical protein JHK82_047413 [Glycine max]|uniref:Uncharacterized protein n=1 Tax=Glycine max TaxID=3847 RepID=A0A0R0FC49_SOYBN|nr:hypothetical protein JHK86_047309 [Glycine max]KAG4943243.1 hypothetical protein JHK85_047889 [Glycine max]KAG5097559.1 hypothetical protein JHK82_047413 [Glycine max]KAG5102350.1 hypothetical protein JHK84_047319 [Glycine max]
MGVNLFHDPWPWCVTWLAFLEQIRVGCSIGKQGSWLAVVETRFLDMNFFKTVNHFLTVRGRSFRIRY